MIASGFLPLLPSSCITTSISVTIFLRVDDYTTASQATQGLELPSGFLISLVFKE